MAFSLLISAFSNQFQTFAFLGFELCFFCHEKNSKNLCLFLPESLPFFAVKKCPEKIPKFVAGKGKDCLETSKSLPAKARLAWSLDFCCSLCRQRGKGRQSKFALAFAFFCLCHAQPCVRQEKPTKSKLYALTLNSCKVEIFATP